MNGGSVGEACIRTGRGYVGIELSQEYYEISRNRLTAVLSESVGVSYLIRSTLLFV